MFKKHLPEPIQGMPVCAKKTNLFELLATTSDSPEDIAWFVGRAKFSSGTKTLEQIDNDKHRIRDETNPEITHASTNKHVKIRKTQIQTTENPFDVLAGCSNNTDKTIFQITPRENAEDITEETEEVVPEKGNHLTHNAKKKAVLPIIVHQRLTNCKQLIAKLRSAAPTGFSIKLTKNATSIYIEGQSQDVFVKDVLRKEKLGFHSYNNKNEKNRAFVLEGLDEECLPEDIGKELRQR